MQIINVVDLPKNYDKVAAVLDSGGLLIFPTETCYGVGVNACNEVAVSKLLKYKERPAGKAISVALGTKSQIFEYILHNEQAENIANNFLPGPITLVGKSTGKVDRRLESELETLGIRLPAYPPLLELLKNYLQPVTATSANVSGGSTPYDIQKLLDELPGAKKAMIDLVIDAGKLPLNPPSLVIDTTQTNKIFRPGLITAQDLEKGEVHITTGADATIKLARDYLKNVLQEAYTTTNKSTSLSRLPNLTHLAQPLIFLLSGELGAGKTHFSKGLAAALDIKKTINSPTFTIVKEYDFSLNLPEVTGTFYHLDLWRISEKTTLEEFELHPSQLSAKKLAILAIEWPENLDLEALRQLRPGSDRPLMPIIISAKIFKLSDAERRIILTRL